MSNGRGGIEDISLLRILFTVGHIAILLPAQTNLSEKKMEPLWCLYLWQGGRAAGQSVTTPPPTPSFLRSGRCLLAQ